jgi:hypothetical protein
MLAPPESEFPVKYYPVCWFDIPEGCYDATYYPQPKGEPGILHICVEDNGLTGQDKEDYISLWLEGGAFPGYSNEGVLQGET